MTRLYIIRHGETESNTRGTCIGQKDVGLTERGREQAQSLARRFKGVAFDAVYTSPLRRAIDTLAPVVGGRSVKITQSYDFIERDYGIFDDMTYAEIAKKYPAEYSAWKKDWLYYTIPDGESSADVQERVNAGLERIFEHEAGKTVLIMTHLGAARHIISRALNLTLENSLLFALDNAAAAVIESDGKKGLLTGLNV